MDKANIQSSYKNILSLMESATLDGFWVSSPENHFYACGVNNPDGRVFISPEKSVVFADFRYFEQANEDAIPEYETVMANSDSVQLAADIFSGKCRRIGYEEHRISAAERDRLASLFPKAELVPSQKLFHTARMCKRDDEIELIIAAQKITDAAFEHIIKIITPNMTELDVAAELEYFMKKSGADDKSFETIAVSGRHSSSPHRSCENRRLENGFLTMDFGALVGMYHSDMTRTVVIGRADSEMRRLYNTVLAAQTAVLDVICEGSSNFEMDKIARDIIDSEAGYAGTFGHSLGHGVGLEIHEQPNLSPKSDKSTSLKAGNVVTVEPGIYIAGKYGCRIEDMIVVRNGYAENITKSTKELIEIG